MIEEKGFRSLELFNKVLDKDRDSLYGAIVDFNRNRRDIFQRPLFNVSLSKSGDEKETTYIVLADLHDDEFTKDFMIGEIRITPAVYGTRLCLVSFLADYEWANQYFSSLAQCLIEPPLNHSSLLTYNGEEPDEVHGPQHSNAEDKSEEDHPWDKVKDHSWDKEAVRLWWAGYRNSEIAERVSVTKLRVTNRISELRKIYGEDIVPKKTERDKYLREKTRDTT